MSTEDYKKTFDTDKWRTTRDQKLLEWTQNEDAVRLLVDIGNVTEVVDDLWDKDRPVKQDRLQAFTYQVFLDIPTNPIMVHHSIMLAPILNSCVRLWMSSFRMEKNPTDHNLNRAYVLRNSFIILVHAVVEICRGRVVMNELATEIEDFFLAEPLNEYKEEIINKHNSSWTPISKDWSEGASYTLYPDGTAEYNGEIKEDNVKESVN